MAVNAKEKKALAKMWSGASANAGSGLDLPDGKYQFKILEGTKFEMTSTGKPRMKMVIKVVGGDEEFVGKKGEVFDNLESETNMAWFKRKLGRLRVAIPKDFGEIMDGGTAGEMVGRVFEGQVKTANDFLNVYVNRLVKEGSDDDEEEDGDDEETEAADAEDDEEEDGEDDEEEGEEEDAEDEDEEGAAAFEVNQTVSFKAKGKARTGTVAKVNATKKLATVECEDGTKHVMDFEALTAVEADDEDGDEEEEEDEDGDDDEDGDAVEMPASADEVKRMKPAQIAEVLAAIEVKPGSDPKSLLATIVRIDSGEKVEGPLLRRAAKALGVKVAEGDKDAAVAKRAKAALSERLGGA